MRIAIVHNKYQDPGGEDTVSYQESELLSETETVLRITYQNRKGLRGMMQFAMYPFNLFATFRILKKLDHFKPDVVHFHNLHYAIGPQIIRSLHRRGIPMVMTLHNYRLLCPSATLFFEGNLFLDSMHQSFPWKAIRLGVYSRSVLKTFWLALTYYLHKKAGTWAMVDRYFVLSEFSRQLFLRYFPSVPGPKFTIKPNFLPDPAIQRHNKPTEHFLFIGRLTTEKGVSLLLDTFSSNGRQLRIVGDGPLKKEVENAAGAHPNIVYLGLVDKDRIYEELAACTALIFPSLWYEGMPMTLIEAFATGTPVIASNLGTMRTMVKPNINGYLFEAGDKDQLETCLREWSELEDSKKQLIREQTRQHYLEFYSTESNKTLLLEQYHLVIAGHRKHDKPDILL